MVNEKYIIAIDAADDAGMWPASRLAAVTCAGDGAVLVTTFLLMCATLY